MKLPNTDDCKRIATTGKRRDILNAIERIREYRDRQWAFLSFIEVQWLDRNANLLKAALND